ncbi:MAG TPA: low specificity L-threonine aldolase, partial [Thermoanaerobaculia bacterium]
EDHENAALLARGLAELPGIELDAAAVRTNIVIFRVAGPAAALLAGLRERGVLGVPVGPHAVRFVTHRDVSRADVEQALELVREVAAAAA